MPRGGLSYKGIYEPSDLVTVQADTDVKDLYDADSDEDDVLELAVTLTDDGKMGLGDSGDRIDGVINKYEDDDYMTVQRGGFAICQGVSGSLPTAGDFVVCNSAGKVIADDNGTSGPRAWSVDESELEVVVLLT